MNNKKQTIIIMICTILPAIGTIVSGIGSIVNNESLLWKCLFLVLAIVFAVANIVSLIINNKLNLIKEKKLKKLENQIAQFENYVGDGKKMLINEAFISVDEQNEKYLISIRKKFEIIDESKSFYIIRLHCDKFLGHKDKAKEYYSANKVNWDEINLKVRLEITNSENKKDVYNDINIIEVEKLDNYYFLKVEYKRKLASGQTSNILFKSGDIFELNYSFNISVNFWGSYIERPVSYFKETTNIYFDKYIPNFNKNQVSLSIVNRQGEISEVPYSKYNWLEDDSKYYKLMLPVNELKLSDIKDVLFRIMWDANAIFQKNDLNTENAEALGFGAALRGSD